MKQGKNTHPQISNSHIQPSLPGQPAHVVQDGWIAYLPSTQHAKASFQNQGRGFLKGRRG